YVLPRGDHPLAVTTELGVAPWAPRHGLLRVGLASRPVATSEMPPANLVFLIDVSGSMSRGGNNRVILATDGDFNVGESSGAAMVRLGDRVVRGRQLCCGHAGSGACERHASC
ncbi:MAG TPA: hypothetical protein VK849_05165, partial [Longimicrobiales bacterium]|nr:hypothetical protein [Longimicrobiales bacterium]